MATTDQPDMRELQFEAGELPPGMTAEHVRSHVIAPAHVRDIRIEEVDPAREKRVDLTFRVPAATVGPPKTLAHCDIGALGTAIHAALKSSVVGYEFEVRKNGTKVYELLWNWSRTPIDGNKGWSENRRMHIASVSKMLTAVGMVKALDSHGISYDAPISGYLPAYWTKGPKVDQITFRHLMTHTSGFSTGGSSSDFTFMKEKVAAGVASTPGTSYDYENMNFGLCRILIPIVTGMMSKDTTYGFMQDVVWDAVTLSHYKNHMQSQVFSPAGVGNAGWAPAAGSALAYRQPHGDLHGWNSGDLQTVAGGAGWRMSVKEVLDVMNHVRRQNTIVSPQKAQTILDSRFGIDQIIDTPAGKTYNKNGAWGTGAGEVEQCVAFYLPEGLEAVLFTNSPIGTQGYSLRALVEDAYEGSLSA
jgi:CubicO group peptidase (beta-lactamase class C family)